MKPHSKSFHGHSPESPHFPNYLQATQASNTKSSKSLPRKNQQQGRSFIYKQENIHGPFEFSGKKKLLVKNDSNGSLLNLMERTDPYIITTKRKMSPPQQDKNSYRIYMPELNCETPKFQGLRTYYKDFVNIDPIANKVLGRSNHEEKQIFIQKKNMDRNKENAIPCLPNTHNEKTRGKKTTFQKVESQAVLNNHVKELIQGNYCQPEEEFVLKKPSKKQNPYLFAGSDIFENLNKSQTSPLKQLTNIQNLQIRHQKVNGILPEGHEKTFKKTPLKYPNQKRILEGDSVFWKNFKNREDSSFIKNDSKVNNLKYKACVDWIKQEKDSFDKYLRNESLDTSQGSIYREHRKKQFPQSPIFRTNIQLG